MEIEETETKTGMAKFNMDNLLTRGVEVDHKAVLEQTAKVLDQFRHSQLPVQDEGLLTQLKTDIADSSSLEEIVAKVSAFPGALVEMTRVVEDGSFEELVLVSRAQGALSGGCEEYDVHIPRHRYSNQLCGQDLAPTAACCHLNPFR